MRKKIIGGLLLAVCLFPGIAAFAGTATTTPATKKPTTPPAAVDTDKDGLSDAQERQFKTDPNNPDTDGDGFKDGQEVDWGYNPLSKDKKKWSQRIVINLKKQRLDYFVDNVLWKEFKVSTGKAKMPTPKGTFKIRIKIVKAWSKDYRLWMPYWLGLTGSVGIHALPIWPNGYQESATHLGTPVSHGCIRLAPREAAYLFDRLLPGVTVKIE